MVPGFVRHTVVNSPVRVDSNPKSTFFVARSGRCLTPKERSNVRQQKARKGSPTENEGIVRPAEKAEGDV
jgi:hypothetical protein